MLVRRLARTQTPPLQSGSATQGKLNRQRLLALFVLTLLIAACGNAAAPTPTQEMVETPAAAASAPTSAPTAPAEDAAQVPDATFVCLCDGLDCTLDASASADDDSTATLRYSWAFGLGDDATEPAETPETTIRYEDEGTYDVTLTVTDDAGQSVSIMGTCNASLSTQPPIADFDSRDLGELTVQLNGSLAYDEDNGGETIVAWEWDIFDDGSVDLEGEAPQFTFEDGGSYPVRLVVTDDEGETGETTLDVAVGVRPVALASGECLSRTARFTGSDSFDQDNADARNNGVTEWRWDFGAGRLNGQQIMSGAAASLQDPVNVIFPDFDDYTITLQVTDADFNRHETEVTVSCVNQPPDPLALSIDLVAGGRSAVRIYTLQDVENDPLAVTWSGLPTWATDGMSFNTETGQVRYDISAPRDSEGTYNGENCADDGVNAPVCAEVTLVVTSNTLPNVTVTDYALVEGEQLIDETQFAWDSDTDDDLFVRFEGLPPFVEASAAAAELSEDAERGSHSRIALRYALSPQLGDAGTYTAEACISDTIDEVCRSFEIVVTQPEDGTGPTCPITPDFDSLDAGTPISDQFEGMTIYSLPPSGSSEDVEQYQADHPVWAYDSSVRGADPDLGTPNRAFDGVGVGAAGAEGDYANDTPLQNLIVIQEDTSTEPDDNSGGGRIVFEFAYPAVVNSLRFVDVDEGNAAEVAAYDVDGAEIFYDEPFDAGENSVVVLPVNQGRVARLEIEFPRSGALDSIFFCDEGP